MVPNPLSPTHPRLSRHSILGVLTSAEWRTQLCFQDTPGVIEEPQYALQDTMMEAVRGSLTQCDVHLVVSDVFSVVP